jgi:hypothetical protein
VRERKVRQATRVNLPDTRSPSEADVCSIFARRQDHAPGATSSDYFLVPAAELPCYCRFPLPGAGPRSWRTPGAG